MILKHGTKMILDGGFYRQALPHESHDATLFGDVDTERATEAVVTVELWPKMSSMCKAAVRMFDEHCNGRSVSPLALSLASKPLPTDCRSASA